MLHLIEEHYFHMNRQEPKLKELSKSRFGSMIFLLRMSGIPFKSKELSTMHSVYMITVITCGCSTFMAMFVDVYIHLDNLGRAMKTMRALISLTNVMWTLSYCR